MKRKEEKRYISMDDLPEIEKMENYHPIYLYMSRKPLAHEWGYLKYPRKIVRLFIQPERPNPEASKEDVSKSPYLSS